MTTEANTVEKEVDDIDTKIDTFLDEHDKPADSSSQKQSAGDEADETQDTGADQSKKANLEKAEAKKSGVEDKLAKIKEILGDDEEAVNAYIKSKGYHTDPAWQKLLAKSKTSAIDEETQGQLDIVKDMFSSPEGLRLIMKHQGYTDEAINKVLRDKGFDVPETGVDDVTLITKKLGMDLSQLPEEERANTTATIRDVAKIVDILFQDRIGKVLPDSLKPIQKSLSEITSKNTASKMVNDMRAIVEEENILDFEEAIEPELRKFMDENEKATLADVERHFQSFYHKLSIERLKLGKKKVERDESKAKNNPAENTNNFDKSKLPKKTGNFDTDLEALLDHYDVR